MSVKPSAVVAIPLAPGQADIERTSEILESIKVYESLVTDVILLDDGPEDRKLEGRFTPPPGVKIHSLRPKRGSNADGKRGGLCHNIIQMFAYALRQTQADMVLRMDTDAAIVGPFVERAASELARAGSKAGLLGCCRYGPDNETRSLEPWNHVFRSLSKPVGISWRSPRVGNFSPFVNVALTGGRRVIQRRIRDALNNGYRLGESPMGGAYLVTRAMLIKWEQIGILDEGWIWEPTVVSEDAMAAVYTHASGFEMADSYRPRTRPGEGDIFAVMWKGLHDHPRRAAKSGYVILHSIKKFNFMTEQEIHVELRAMRQEFLNRSGL